MPQRKVWWLVVVAFAIAFVLVAVIVSLSHPCRQRLNRFAAALDEIWRDPNLIAQIKTPNDYRRLLEERVREPLTCPDTGTPYQFFPAAGIVLADPQPHGFRKGYLAIEWRHTPDGERFRFTFWSPSTTGATVSLSSQPVPSFFQAFFDFLRKLTAMFSPQAPQVPMDCPSRLKNVGLSLIQYVQDYDECFPPMKVTAETQAVLKPYIRSMDMFFCPITKQPYQPNPHLHLKRLIDIPQPSDTPSFYDAVLHPDGMRGVAYADGHAKFALSQWQALQQRYRLPLPP